VQHILEANGYTIDVICVTAPSMIGSNITIKIGLGG
jgi:hypothetical protein